MFFQDFKTNPFKNNVTSQSHNLVVEGARSHWVNYSSNPGSDGSENWKRGRIGERTTPFGGTLSLSLSSTL